MLGRQVFNVTTWYIYWGDWHWIVTCRVTPPTEGLHTESLLSLIHSASEGTAGGPGPEGLEEQRRRRRQKAKGDRRRSREDRKTTSSYGDGDGLESASSSGERKGLGGSTERQTAADHRRGQNQVSPCVPWVSACTSFHSHAVLSEVSHIWNFPSRRPSGGLNVTCRSFDAGGQRAPPGSTASGPARGASGPWGSCGTRGPCASAAATGSAASAA